MIYLAGDSVFDNGAYTSPSLIQQMGAGARLLARDGATLATLPNQLRSARLCRRSGTLFPDDTVVISIGGNDALPFAALVTGNEPSARVLATLEREVTAFEHEYESVIRDRPVCAGHSHQASVVLCTIYNGNFRQQRAEIAAGVRLFDDAIQRVARRTGAGLIDLRDIFTDPADFANEIEPSHIGGAKLAEAIKRAVERP